MFKSRNMARGKISKATTKIQTPETHSWESQFAELQRKFFPPKKKTTKKLRQKLLEWPHDKLQLLLGSLMTSTWGLKCDMGSENGSWQRVFCGWLLCCLFLVCFFFCHVFLVMKVLCQWIFIILLVGDDVADPNKNKPHQRCFFRRTLKSTATKRPRFPPRSTWGSFRWSFPFLGLTPKGWRHEKKNPTSP